MKTGVITIMLVSLLMMVPFTAFAQMKEGGMKGGMMPGGGMGMDHDMMSMMFMMRAMKGLDLTPEQRKNIEQEKIKHQKEAIPLFGKIQLAGIELKEILMSYPVDAAKAKEKIKEKHDGMAELEMSHVLLTQQIKALLTPEQRERPGSPKGEDPYGH